MIIYKNDSAVAWGSKRQGIVSRSTMESEYIAMFTTANHVIPIIALETQFGLKPLRPYIWCDNQAAISIATGGGMNFKRSHFMNIKYHWVRKAYEGKEFYINYVESQSNVTNLFTKRLPPNPLKYLRGYFMEDYFERDNIEEYEDSEEED